jgi:two-component system cell cycle sensor histidine kinase/response regulator CckA
MNNPIRILYVEDCPYDREIIADALRREDLDCEFVYAASEEEFKKALARQSYDLILSDFTLPSFSGAAALELVRADRPDIPFLFVSGTIGEERAVESLRQGATDYVLKDRLDRLGQAVRRALHEAEEHRERLRAEQLLRASEERFRQVVENIHEVFWLTDPDKNVLHYISPGYEQIWGRTCESLYQSPRAWLDAIHGEDRQRVFDAALTKQSIGEYDEVYRVIRPDGSVRWVHDRAFPLNDAGGKAYRVAGIAEDITQQRNLEEQIRHMQKMESIGQLAGGIAHDFNNALTVIRLHASLLASGPLTETAKESVKGISQAGEHATTLTQQLLTFSRRREIQIRELNLNEIVAGIIKMIRRVLGKSIALQFSAGEIRPILADAGMLEQVFMNLALNARDAMPNGGSLNIRTGMETISETFAQQNPAASAGSFVWLEMTDTGVGIPPENLSKVFEPFFTTKEPGKGTGLGLASVYGIVKQHRGWITLQSQANCGTTFKIYLPARSGPADSARTSVCGDKIQGGNETILLVEEQSVVCALVRNILESCGYQVFEAKSSAEALQQWEKHQGKIDLLLTDLVLPGDMSGRELAKTLRAKNPHLKIVFTSGYAPEIVGQDCEEAKFLQKPYAPRSLAKSIRSFLDSPGGI